MTTTNSKQGPFQITETHARFCPVTDGIIGSTTHVRDDLGSFETARWALAKAGQLSDQFGDADINFGVIDANGKPVWLSADAEVVGPPVQFDPTSDEIPF